MSDKLMKSIYIKEQKRYLLTDLSKLFDINERETKEILKVLKSYGVLKIVYKTKNKRELSDIVDVDDEISVIDSDTESVYYYIFTFVGIMIVSGIVLKCYPKYIFKNDTPVIQLKQILKVIEKQNKKEQFIKFHNESLENSSYNILATILYLYNDYHEYGIYTTTQDIFEMNGTGEINWDKTINETFTLISNNKPFYPELITRKKIDDDNDYFKVLHEAILTRCSKQLKKSALLELFEYEELNLIDKKIEDFGDKDYILNKILKELNVQFNTRKQLLLKTMYAYISSESDLGNNSDFSLYGTNSFHVIWENVCAEVFDNMLNQKLSQLSLPIKLRKEYNENSKLISIIEKPCWSHKFGEFESDTLIPDLISIYHDNNQEYKFIIFDAKYYTIKLNEKTMLGQPGIESITKQYLYQLAYKKFIEDHGFEQKNIRNCFLLPTENSEVEEFGSVSMEMLTTLGLEKIQVRLLPAEVIYGKYLKKTKFDINLLNL
jgi:hypothetical protein